jgi:FKBP-type peptidyl-prolyl cis-trans isomerase SlyD
MGKVDDSLSTLILRKGSKMKPQVISFHYNLTDKTGKPIESSRKGEPLICLEGAGQILPGLEEALSALKKGEKKTVKLAAIDAYGEHDAKLIVQVPKAQLPPVDGGGELKKGFQFQSETPEGHLQIFTVTDDVGWKPSPCRARFDF